MRRLISGTTAFVALTGAVLVLPVYAEPTPEAVPVETSVEEVALGSVEQPAAEADVQQGTTEPVAGVAETAPALTVRRTGLAEFSLVGVTWAHDPAVSDVLVQVRVQDDDGAWGSWTEVGSEDLGQDAGQAQPAAQRRSGTAPLWTGPSTGVEVEVVTRSGAAPTDVQLDLVDPGESPADGALGSPDIQDTADAALAMPDVYSRAQWGADESLRTWAPQYASTIKAATLHHTAETNDYSADRVPEMLRGIYRYHAVSLKWGDIGYNVLVDKYGRLWEGRSGGLASTVIGAHAGGFNTSTFGVSMMGNYDVVDTPQPMVDAVAAIIGWKFSLYDVNPNGTATLTSGGTDKWKAGTAVTLPTIHGHRDTKSTACPGRYGYARLGEIRGKVTSALATAVPLVQQRYDSDPAARSLLGAVTTAPTPTPDGGGAYAHYANGSIYASRGTGARVLRGPIRDAWAAQGWERGRLGYPTTDVTVTPDGAGLYAHFQNGSVYWTAATGAHTVGGAVRDRWSATGWETGQLGYPTSDWTTTPDGKAQFVHFQKGSVYWSQATGARILRGEVYAKWAAAGWERSTLGLPTSDVTGTPNGAGSYAHFQNGSVYWTAASGAHTVGGPVRDRWSATGWENGPLGFPVSDWGTTPDGKAQFVHFQKGSVYWSQDTGARVLSGRVYEAWAASGWERSSLGLPVSDTATTPDGRAQYAHFQQGSIYSTGASGAHVLPAEVVAVWSRTGWERGPLGYPTSSAAAASSGSSTVATPDGMQVQDFQGGVVYTSPSTGTHAVSGAFTGALTAAGGTAVLGFPTTDARATPDGKAQYQHFTGGSVYVTATGAWALRGPVLDLWGRTGWERGVLGYPTSSVAATTDGQGLYARFQGGSVYWSRATGAHAVRGAVLEAWVRSGAETGTLRYPTTSVTPTPDGKGSYAYFQGGAVYSSAVGGTRVLTGAVLDAWGRAGWEQGQLGWPTSDTVAAPGGGTRTEFERGSITVSATGTATVSVR
ncbi:N-acetylmuramoyl-L-alanine amidase [Geodermatophilus sp. DSM 45219]|uniref:N-acetylmuramoyl-L-alanine amidase n=1 Tax=Geodermatophilus sp. DSM 45219 TaxID=1881103 RepID=UPI00088583F0|nr:N-acetylmuramoyl-L-alanine amidase [Geodermatophilus sp. DSM 45219]SDO32735.1 N-acetylmuramoyl-L-alanine amidase [Geodermatophilus sp. DSM 45219]